MGLANKQWLDGKPLRYRRHRKIPVRVSSARVPTLYRQNGVQAIFRFERSGGDYQSLCIETEDVPALVEAVAGCDPSTRRQVVYEVLKRDGLKVLRQVLVEHAQDLAEHVQKEVAWRVVIEHNSKTSDRSAGKGSILVP